MSSACYLASALVLAVAAAGSGCAGGARWQESREGRDSLVRKALAKEQAGDQDGAIQVLRRALERKPRLAYAHLKLAGLLEQHRKDYIGAIYHYRNYLEFAPKSEKRDRVEDWIEGCRRLLVHVESDQPRDAAGTIAKLRKENALLADSVAELERFVSDYEARLRVRTDVSGARPRQVAGARPPAGSVEYRVQQGDTLSRIAAKFYGDPTEWHRIFKTNRELLQRPEALTVGQTLVIPSNEP